MDWQFIVNLGAGTVLAIVGYYVKAIKEDQQRSTDGLQTLRVKLAEEYVTHASLQRSLTDIKDALRRIESKIESRD